VAWAAWITRRPAAPAQGKGHRLSLKTGDAIALTTFWPGPAAGAACGFSRQREGRHGRAGNPLLNSGDVRIDYQMTGSGPLDLVFVPGFVSNLDVWWEEPPSTAGIAEVCRRNTVRLRYGSVPRRSHRITIQFLHQRKQVS
jgi:hypothetical protein